MSASAPKASVANTARFRARVLGTGTALPGPAITTRALIERVQPYVSETRPRLATRLAQRLGVETRHVCRDFAARREAPRPEHRNPMLAREALQRALDVAGIAVHDLGYLIGHTATPSRPLPTNISEVASMLNYAGPFAEFRQACTGFANALQFATALLAAPNAAPVAIVGSETGSVFFDPESLLNDHTQWVNFLQMGDGAGAVVLAPFDGRGLSIELPFIGQLTSAAAELALNCGGSDAPWCDATVMNFSHDYVRVAERGPALLAAGRATLEAHGERMGNAAKIVPHQANGRMSAWLEDHWQLRPGQCFGNGAQVGNLGSASIWVALDALLESAALRPNERAWFLGAEATQYTYGGFVLANLHDKA